MGEPRRFSPADRKASIRRLYPQTNRDRQRAIRSHELRLDRKKRTSDQWKRE